MAPDLVTIRAGLGLAVPDEILANGALPDAARKMPPAFEHYTPEPVRGEGTELRVFLGSLAGSSSPVPTYTPPLLGAEAVLRAGARLDLELDPAFEHGILLDTGNISLGGTPLAVDHLHYLRPGRGRIVLEAGQTPARLVLLGGEPLGERIVMWWHLPRRHPYPPFGPFPDGYPAPLPAQRLAARPRRNHHPNPGGHFED
ncbi:pirin-like C-terminal cupin domain-containing protein [Arthrobacter sp. UYCo732]|uniref:pirin-like C-terminal cupin domain-containing protein n=1 Tax=Arthrobacter sp. UYCo732 TaxID=3156336 RepID=UPI0033990FF7